MRLGWANDSAQSWRALLTKTAPAMAKAMDIPWDQFHWYAAFHDEGHHPHIHMVCYSADGKSGFLTKQGIADIKSMLAKEIFQQDLAAIYQRQTQRRDDLTQSVGEIMGQLVTEMRSGAMENQRIGQLMVELAQRLRDRPGKKQYGYLPKRMKKQVDEIVDQMARLPSVKSCYEKWLELQQMVNGFYSDKPIERTPLSQQKEFRAIHNAVVQAAVQMEQLTFEDKGMEENDGPDDVTWDDAAFQQLWTVIRDDSFPLDLRDEGVARLHSKAEDGDHYAQLLLGRLYRDGPLLTPDWVEARYWFEQAAQSLPDAQYALGKLLLSDDVEIHDREQGLRWLTQAAENGHEYAAYRLSKELLIAQNIAGALLWLTISAAAGNPCAEYLLGKLYWEGEYIPQDTEQAVYWLTQAVEQGHPYAQILLERQDSSSLPSAILAVNSLLHSIGRIFQDNAWIMYATQGQHTDRKLRRRIQEKKIAMGHKPDDHEDQGYIGPAM